KSRRFQNRDPTFYLESELRRQKTLRGKVRNNQVDDISHYLGAQYCRYAHIVMEDEISARQGHYAARDFAERHVFHFELRLQNRDVQGVYHLHDNGHQGHGNRLAQIRTVWKQVCCPQSEY